MNSQEVLYELIIPYIINAGLYGVARLGPIAIDHALVTILIEGGDKKSTHYIFQLAKQWLLIGCHRCNDPKT